MNRNVMLKATSALVAGLAIMPAIASAQSVTETQGAAIGGGLEEIIVTAQRRSESSQKAAIAITAVSGADIARAAITDTMGLVRVAPSLQISTIGGSATQFYLRGVGNFTTNSNSDAAVSVAIDGITIARSSAVQGLFYDLDRVEVLKGPQGTLYGRNATGGQINVVTHAPEKGVLGGYLTGEYGNYNAHKLEGAVNIPMGQDGALRVSGLLSKHDGYLSDGSDDEDMRALRVQMAAQLTDTFHIRVGGDYAFVGGVGPGVVVRGMNADDRIGSRDPRANPYITSGFSFRAGAFLGPIDTMKPYQRNNYAGAYVQADVDTSLGTLTVLPGYRRADVNFLTCTTQCFISNLKDDQFSFETRLVSKNSGPVSYLVGLFYLNERAHERANYNQQFNSFYSDFSNNIDSYAAFSRLTFNVSDAFRLTAAGRYTIDRKSAVIDAINTRVVCSSILAGGAPCIGTPPISPVQLNAPANLFTVGGALIPFQPYGPSGAGLVAARATNTPVRTFKKFTYRLGFEYDLAPQSLLYGSYETGFKSGGFFNSIDNPVYRPETISAWTLGSKNRFFDNKVQANLELFWWDYKDQQISQFATNSAGGVEFVTLNIGKTRVRGAELELQAKLTPTTTARGTVQYLDTERLNFVYRTPAAVGPPNSGCAVTAPSGGFFTVNCTGQRAINAPEWTVNAGIEQVFNVSANARLIFNADGRYTSWAWVGNEQLPQQRQNGYFNGDFQLKLEFDQPKVFIAGYVNNVGNKTVVGYSALQPVAPSVTFNLLRAPRTYGVRAGIRF